MGFFELALGLLFLLAVIDLSVGVSNDAVNFLNSAIGSRVSSRRVIMIVAGGGVLAGSLFSSGIMEVARSGIFNPELFVFADVMVIFLAVMLADVLLLDLFNTFAMPTSTTVSIVFELLGAAVAVAFLLLLENGSAGSVLDYVNVRQAALIISGIGISVFVAFVCGTIIQFISRLLFTFQEKNRNDVVRIGWCAVAFTVISYFLIIKGLKGASFVTEATYAYLYANTALVTAASLAAWVCLMWLLNRLRFDIMALVVLGGTFSLALAFASNDLVNFVGVPLAGLSAWQAWSGSGVAADAMTMEALSGPVRSNTALLLCAGVIMVVTLWLSSKARSVTQTEVNLGRQDDGAERFSPGPVSRGIVRAVIATGESAAQAIPAQWRTELAARFAREQVRSFDLNRPAFDTLRASVNLTVASILIVFATSLKLPLSTTFVSFMVAMGTSLADRAWGRDAAVYRLAGVFSVIGGWLVTALAAFLMAALFATLIRTFGAPALLFLITAAGFALWHSYHFHKKRSRMAQMMLHSSPDSMDRDALVLRRQVSDSLLRHADVVDKVLTMLVGRRRKMAKKLRKSLRADISTTQETETEFVRRLRQIRPKVEPWLMNQFDVLACERDMLQSAATLADLAGDHVLNEHNPPSEPVCTSLTRLRRLFGEGFSTLAGKTIGVATHPATVPLQQIPGELDQLTGLVVNDLYEGASSTRNTTLMLGVVLELRDLHRELQRVATWQ